MGIVIGNQEFNKSKIDSSDEFKTGLKDGQAITVKLVRSKFEKKSLILGATGLVAGALSISFGDQVYESIEKIEYAKNFKHGFMGGCVGSYLYGQISVRLAGLFQNDNRISEKLITNGPYKMHRNPLYFGNSLACTLASLSFFSITAFSTAPNLVAGFSMALGSGLMIYGQHRYTLQDEKSLEITFGQEYLDYKSKTPRYFPAVWNLFKKDKKKV